MNLKRAGTATLFTALFAFGCGGIAFPMVGGWAPWLVPAVGPALAVGSAVVWLVAYAYYPQWVAEREAARVARRAGGRRGGCISPREAMKLVFVVVVSLVLLYISGADGAYAAAYDRLGPWVAFAVTAGFFGFFAVAIWLGERRRMKARHAEVSE